MSLTGHKARRRGKEQIYVCNRTHSPDNSEIGTYEPSHADANAEFVMLLQSIAAVTFVIKFVQHFLYEPSK
jgi:hypothetical protein